MPNQPTANQRLTQMLEQQAVQHRQMMEQMAAQQARHNEQLVEERARHNEQLAAQQTRHDELLAQLLQQQSARLHQQQPTPQLPTPPGQQDAHSATITSSLDARITKFDYDPDNGFTFDRWFQRYGNCFEEDGKHLEEAAKVRLLVSKLNDTDYNSFADNIRPMRPDQLPFNDAVKQLKELFGDTRSVFVRQFECFKIKQGPHQDVTAIYNQVNAACENADFSACCKEKLKCMIFITALRDDLHDLRQKCLQLLEEARRKNEDLTLKKLREECRAYQEIRLNANLLVHSTRVKFADAISSHPQQWRPKNVKGKSKPASNNKPKNAKSEDPQKQSACNSCGRTDHQRSKCKFREAICHQCQKQGHIKAACRSKPAAPDESKKVSSSIHTVAVTSYCMSTETQDVFIKWWNLPLKINGTECLMKVDTGAQITLLTAETWHKLRKPSMSPTNLEVKNCNGGTFSIDGELQCEVQHGKKLPKKLTAFVSSDIKHDLLGLPWFDALEIIPKHLWAGSTEVSSVSQPPMEDANNKDDLQSTLQMKFPDVFNPELGHCTKVKARLHVKQDAKPVFCKARPVPHGAKDAVNAEIDRLLAEGVIKPVDFSHWAAPIVAVKKKNGKTRVCIDFSTGLNDNIELNRHPLPRPEDIYTAVNGASFFSQLDLRDAYLQMELDDESKKLCGINTHRGLFQCERLPFGVKSAPAIFQKLMDQLVSGIPGAFTYLDDLIIAGQSLQQHNAALFQVFTRLQDYGLRIQMEKCHFLQNEIAFLGHIVSAKGIRPDPARSEAIKHMPAPHDVSTLRSFLGALNYYGRFIKQLRELRGPFDELLKKDVKWQWNEEHQTMFDKAKETMLSNLLLTHYDPAMPIIVAADASKDGIGAVLSHIFPDKTEKAVEHASCSFTPAQKNYSQIEKEALAIVFAVQKFHRMLYGRHFILQTDHKPLLAIFGSKKGIPIHAASRLQRWALTLLNYDFEIRYISTESFGKADVLSRLIDNYPKPEEDVIIAAMCTESECYASSVFEVNIEPLPVTAADIAEESRKDPILQKIAKLVTEGWPQTCRDEDIAPYFPRRTAISEIEGCLVFEQRTIIPMTLRKKILKALHMTHPGIVRMKAIARQHVYWPGLNLDIERLVRTCEECQLAAKLPAKVPLQPWPLTSTVFERIHIDFAGPCSDGNVYLIIVDAYSKWPFVIKMSTTTSSRTIKELNALFNIHGIPVEIVSDNGPQFRSSEFTNFCKENRIKHLFTPPFHPQSNGQAERFVDTFKRTMMKNTREGKGWLDRMLLVYRSTPNVSLNGRSPDELFLGRRLRTKLTLLHPDAKQLPMSKEPGKTSYQQTMAKQFDTKHGAKPRKYDVNELVYTLNYRFGKKMWLPGTIIERLQNSPTYRVHVPTLNADVHRHANQLRKRLSDKDQGR